MQEPDLHDLSDDADYAASLQQVKDSINHSHFHLIQFNSQNTFSLIISVPSCFDPGIGEHDDDAERQRKEYLVERAGRRRSCISER